jgi:hypothetical protein
VLVHRDFHPGNVLWQRGAVTGVVDWQAACTGPAVADVGHCRINLLTAGTDAAVRFTAWWQHAAGTAYHPWADVVTIIGFLDDLRDGWGPERLLVEDMLARAVAELGGQAGWLRGRRTCHWAPLRTSRAGSPGRTPSAETGSSPGAWASRSSRSSVRPPPGAACATDPARFREWQKGVVDGHMDGARPAGARVRPWVRTA